MLPPKLVTLIESEVDRIFDRAKKRVLGVSPDKVLLVDAGLSGVFREANVDEGGIPDVSTLKALMRTVSNYIDATRAKAKARILSLVHGYMQEAEASGGNVTEAAKTSLNGAISDLWTQVTSELRRIVETETQNVRNTGLLNGIIRSNASSGIEDPMVFWIIVRDENVCDECVKIHTIDGLTPRVWRLSEVSHQYHKKGDSSPSIGGLHPHCRCMLTTILPGWGFGEDGRVKWIGEDYDVFTVQRGE